MTLGGKGWVCSSFCAILVSCFASRAVVAEVEKRPPKRNTTPSAVQSDVINPAKPLSLDDIEDADLKEAWSREARTRWTVPPLGTSAQSGFGADWGSFFLGTSFVNHTPNTTVADGALFAGFGVGDARKNVGLEPTLIVQNLDPFAQDLKASIKLHRMLSETFGISLGYEGIRLRGASDTPGSPFAAVTKIIRRSENDWDFLSVIGLHGGIGGGRFRLQEKGFPTGPDYSVFGSIGLRLWAPISVAAAWSGHDIDFAIPLAPFRSFRLTVVPSVTDIAGIAGRSTTFAFTVVYSESFFSDTFPLSSVRSYR